MPKIPFGFMDELFFENDIEDESVIQGPDYGEDASVIKMNDEQYLVAHPDPISGAVNNIGWLSINIPSNDIAVCGAEPRWALPAIQVPEDMGEDDLRYIVADMKEAAADLGISIVGGHTETVEGIERPLVTTTVLGMTDEPVLTSGSEPGDILVQIAPAGIEGTWILACDFEEELLDRGVREGTIEKVKSWRDRISVVEEALRIKDRATSMHDPTEGGVIQGSFEMAKASGNDIFIDTEIDIAHETRELCDALSIDPMKLISSGCLLATVPREDDIEYGTRIGKVEEGSGDLYHKEDKVEETSTDELFRVIERLG